MRTMSERFLRKWRTCKRLSPIRRAMPEWMSHAIKLDAEMREATAQG